MEFDAQLGTPLYPYRTEWKVYDASLSLAGTIDMVFRKEDRADSPLVLYDWKRSKKITRDNRWQSALPEGLRHLPDSNFWRYALQMNLYRYIIEKNYDHTVEGMFLVAVHPNNPNGSPNAITGLTTQDGRVTIMMPHPERLADRALGGDDGRAMFDSLVEALGCAARRAAPTTGWG